MQSDFIERASRIQILAVLHLSRINDKVLLGRSSSRPVLVIFGFYITPLCQMSSGIRIILQTTNIFKPSYIAFVVGRCFVAIEETSSYHADSRVALESGAVKIPNGSAINAFIFSVAVHKFKLNSSITRFTGFCTVSISGVICVKVINEIERRGTYKVIVSSFVVQSLGNQVNRYSVDKTDIADTGIVSSSIVKNNTIAPYTCSSRNHYAVNHLSAFKSNLCGVVRQDVCFVHIPNSPTSPFECVLCRNNGNDTSVGFSTLSGNDDVGSTFFDTGNQTGSSYGSYSFVVRGVSHFYVRAGRGNSGADFNLVTYSQLQCFRRHGNNQIGCGGVFLVFTA